MSKASEFVHLPIMLDEVLDLLVKNPDGTYVDCTLGGGGHSSAILKQLGTKGRLISIDRDGDALAAGQAKLEAVGALADWQVVYGNFADIDDVFDRVGLDQVDGMLADFGVSSWQLDEADRGFAYSQAGPLDMRMDRTRGQTAADVVNAYSQAALAQMIRKYGEERYAGRIASAIVEYRKTKPLTTTSELADVIRKAMPAASLREQQHPAKRTFQAIRIEVNQELAAVESLLAKAPELLKPGGRLCIITFHSLEDRLVKDAFRTLANPCTCPREFPVCVCGKQPQGRVVTRKGVVADKNEQQENPRSRSARLRCFEKFDDNDMT